LSLGIGLYLLAFSKLLILAIYPIYCILQGRMVSGKQLRMALDKFMKSPVCQHARVQIELPNGEMYDLTAMMLLENRLLGSRETHRLVLKCEKPTLVMGKAIKKVE
jgi:hypothetical protein